MKRREFITLIGGAIVLPSVAEARHAEKVYRIGILSARPEGPAEFAKVWKQFFDGLRDHGYVEGQNLIVEWRYSEGHSERWPELADQLVGLKVDIIVTPTTPAALAAKKATSTVPIVITAAFDPVGTGLASSLAKPGGNVTGLGLLIPEISAKALTLLKEAVPHASRIAVLWNPANVANVLVWSEVETVARATGLVLHSQEVREVKDVDVAFVELTEERPEGLLIIFDALLLVWRERIVEFTIHNQLPAVSFWREFVEVGGLMSYGPNLADMAHRAADYADKILNGANPADIPIEQPTKFDLVINLKTAKAFGLTIPHNLLVLADEVIE
jgi:putative tryptophan/tyrosine transport system substrate-binding protein